MKHVFHFLSLVIVLSLLIAPAANAGDKSIALAVKVIKDVSRKSETIDWTQTKKGDLIYSGDQVRTGDRSVAIVKFTDNSILRVREQSELQITGEQKDNVLQKNIHLTKGQFSFDIRKQQDNEKFIFSSPTSVAAIRGTQGTMTRSDSGDIIVVLEGLVNLVNTSANTSLDINAGETGLSYDDGRIVVRKSTGSEKDGARQSINAANGRGKENILDIDLKDAQNNKKRLHIRYKE
jgi:hypothetical protein